MGKTLVNDLKNYLGKTFEVLVDTSDKLAVREIGQGMFYQWNKKDFAFGHLEGSDPKTAQCFSLNDFFKLIVNDYIKE